LDLPFEYNKFWIENLINNRIYLPKIECRSFTHIIQIDQTEDQWKHFTSSLMEKPEDLTISSGYDRYLLKKPKPPV
jgi:adenylate/nucleoside-diphosphate kinase